MYQLCIHIKCRVKKKKKKKSSEVSYTRAYKTYEKCQIVMITVLKKKAITKKKPSNPSIENYKRFISFPPPQIFFEKRPEGPLNSFT